MDAQVPTNLRTQASPGCLRNLDGSRRSGEGRTDLSLQSVGRDPLFLLACAVVWRTHRNPNAGRELIQAAESWDSAERTLALDLLGRVAGHTRPADPEPFRTTLP